MATFLSLAKDLARESGTLSPDQITTVVGQTDRAAKLVQWVINAWLRIQRKRPDWLWMRAEATKTLVAGTARYSGASAPWSITRFDRFLIDNHSFLPVSLYVTADGTADEGTLAQITYEEWFAKYGRGSGLLTENRNRPTEYAISPAGEICFGPIPDASTYTVRFFYMKTPQTLAADADVPEMPAHYHDLIVWEARRLLLLSDRSFKAAAEEQYEAAILYNELNHDQLPPITIDGSL